MRKPLADRVQWFEPSLRWSAAFAMSANSPIPHKLRRLPLKAACLFLRAYVGVNVALGKA